jgi:hypothetical protein
VSFRTLSTGVNLLVDLSMVIDTQVSIRPLYLPGKFYVFHPCLHLTLCLARALHRILEWKNHGVEWYHHEIPTVGVLNMIVKRINEASVCEFFTQFTPMNFPKLR